MLSGFDHATIAVAELASAIALHEALLGAPPFWRGEHEEAGTHAALFGLRNAVLELVAPKPAAEGSEEAQRAEGLRAWLAQAGGGGVQALAFATADAEQLSAALRERGVRATKPQDGQARGSDGVTRTYRTVELSPRAARGLSVLAVQRPEPLVGLPFDPTGSQVDALDHVVLRTSDADAAVALYRDALGIRLALDTPLRSTRMLFFRIGGVTLEVVLDPSAGEIDALWGLAYRVGDIDAARARIAQAGLCVSEVRDGMKPGTRIFSVQGGVCGVPTLVLRDPSRD